LYALQVKAALLLHALQMLMLLVGRGKKKVKISLLQAMEAHRVAIG
jgi:hypothetical protein